MKNTDPETYYNYSPQQREQFDAINFIDLTENSQSTFEAADPDARSWYPTFGASLSTDQSSPSKGTLSYSGTISATEACPSLYLSAIAYDSSGSVVSEMANTRYGSSQVTVANIRYNLKSGGTYHVAYYGIIEAPAGLTPSSGVVSSAKYITLK